MGMRKEVIWECDRCKAVVDSRDKLVPVMIGMNSWEICHNCLELAFSLMTDPKNERWCYQGRGGSA
jgi:hypothetical protein